MEWMNECMGACLDAQLAEFLGKGGAVNLNAHKPVVTSVVSALGKEDVGSKLFATDGSNPAGVTSSVARRESQGFT